MILFSFKHIVFYYFFRLLQRWNMPLMHFFPIIIIYSFYSFFVSLFLTAFVLISFLPSFTFINACYTYLIFIYILDKMKYADGEFFPMLILYNFFVLILPYFYTMLL